MNREYHQHASTILAYESSSGNSFHQRRAKYQTLSSGRAEDLSEQAITLSLLDLLLYKPLQMAEWVLEGFTRIFLEIPIQRFRN